MDEKIGKTVNFIHGFYDQIDIEVRNLIFGAFEIYLDEDSIVIAYQSYTDDKRTTSVTTTHNNEPNLSRTQHTTHRSPISITEKDGRRKENLRVSCGLPGHFIPLQDLLLFLLLKILRTTIHR